MASSFEKAFMQSYQAEMARRKDAEAEIAREARAEKRFEREMEARKEAQRESEDRAHLQKIEDELRHEDQKEAERQRVENEARWLAASRTDPSIAADFTGDWRDDQRKIAAMRDIDIRADKAGVDRFDGPQYFQPAGQEGGRPVTEATPAYIASLEAAEERQKAQRAAAHVREAEEARLGAGRSARENIGFDRAVSEFGMQEALKREGSWDNFYENRDASSKLERAVAAAIYQDQHRRASDIYWQLPPSQRKGIDVKEGELTRKGVSQLMEWGGYEQVEHTDPITGEKKWIKTARYAGGNIQPLEPGASGQQPQQPPGQWQGPKNSPRSLDVRPPAPTGWEYSNPPEEKPKLPAPLPELPPSPFLHPAPIYQWGDGQGRTDSEWDYINRLESENKSKLRASPIIKRPTPEPYFPKPL